MITRLCANNFRSLVDFTAQFDSFAVLCGPNGAGKSAVFDAIRLIRTLALGDGYLGAEGESDVPRLEFTRWLESTVQEFELSLTSKGRAFEYLLHLELAADDTRPRIIREQARCDQRLLLERDLEGVRFHNRDGKQASFPLDWRQTALASIQPSATCREIELLQQAIANVFVIRPSPRTMERESKAESKYPDLSLSNLISWYCHLSREPAWSESLHDSLREVWPDFESFHLIDVGLHAKTLQLQFERFDERNGRSLFFGQLSDGEKALIGLYMIRAALAADVAQTVLIDEPDNYVGLPELQPWILSLLELLDEDHQAIVISHHPEILNSAGEQFGRYLWRENHVSPTRIGPLAAPSGLSAGEAITRGWIRA